MSTDISKVQQCWLIVSKMGDKRFVDEQPTRWDASTGEKPLPHEVQWDETVYLMIAELVSPEQIDGADDPVRLARGLVAVRDDGRARQGAGQEGQEALMGRNPKLDLLPCPNLACGGDVSSLLIERDPCNKMKWYGWIRCDWCGVQGPTGAGEEDAIREWNLLPRERSREDAGDED